MAGKTESQATESKVAAPVGGVDVLAVMDEAQRVLGEVHFKYQHQIGPLATQALASVHQLPKARAAVDELAAAGLRYLAAELAWAEDDIGAKKVLERLQVARSRFESAIARATGAAS